MRALCIAGYGGPMETIKGANRVIDKFGPGLDGFQSGLPPASTSLTPEWFDSVQQEIVNVLLDQGIVLDGLQLDQMSKALADYQFSNPVVNGSLTIAGGAMLFVENTGTIEVKSGAGLVLKNGSTFAVEANVTFFWSDNTLVMGTSNTNDVTINGNVTLGTGTGAATVTVGADVADAFEVNATTTMHEDVTVDNGGTFTCGKIIISPAIAPSGPRELVAGSDGQLVYQPVGGIESVHHSSNGWTYATGEQEASSGTFATNLSLFTAQRATPKTNDVIVIAEGWGQRSIAGIVTLQLQWDDGAGVYTDQGASVNWSWVDTASATVWSYFRIARRLSPNTAINRLYRLKVLGNGGALAAVREATIRVVNPQR